MIHSMNPSDFPGATDSHTHVVGPLTRYPYAGSRAYTPHEAPLPAWRAMLAGLGMQRCVVVQPSFYGTDNACTLDAAEHLGANGRAVVLVDANADAATLRAALRPCVRGLRINFVHPGQNLAAARDPEAARRLLAPYLALARDHDLHLQLFQEPAGFLQALPALADAGVDWVADHLAMIPAAHGCAAPAFQLLRDHLASRGWVKLSGFYRLSQQRDWSDVAPMVRALVAAAPDRCLWGSDWPHTGLDHAVDPRATLAALQRWVPDPALQRRILVDNPARLYHFASG